eukprot:scaffold70748_cov20-Tisochrysis_lutea.AAC.3
MLAGIKLTLVPVLHVSMFKCAVRAHAGSLLALLPSQLWCSCHSCRWSGTDSEAGWSEGLVSRAGSDLGSFVTQLGGASEVMLMLCFSILPVPWALFAHELFRAHSAACMRTSCYVHLFREQHASLAHALLGCQGKERKGKGYIDIAAYVGSLAEAKMVPVTWFSFSSCSSSLLFALLAFFQRF